MKKHLLKNILAPIVALFVAFVALPQAAQAQTKEAYLVEKGTTLTFYYDANKATRTGTIYDINDKRSDYTNVPAWAGTFKNKNTRITKVVFDKSFKVYKPTSMKYWFSCCTKLETIDGIENLSTDQVTTMFCMFENCYALKSLDLKNFDTSNVTDMNGMFSSCSSLSTLDLSNFDTSNVTDMYLMFSSCSSLSSLDLSSFDTSKVTSMGFMFSSCSSLSSLDLSSFDTSNVTDMYRMFYSCSSLSSLDLSSFDTSNVTVMNNMFDSCSSLSSLYLLSFDTSNVTDMNSMFSSCSSLSTLDLSYFDTSKVSDMARMFYNCSKLTTIYCKGDWNSDVVSTSNDMFKGCTSLKGAVAYDASKVDVSMANPTTGYFTAKEAYLVEKGTTLTFYFDHNKATRTGTIYDINDKRTDKPSIPAWAGTFSNKNTRITKVVFDNSFKDYKLTSTAHWFYCCTKLETIEGIENLSTNKVTTMFCMFENCSALKSLDLKNFDTSNVTDMNGMFRLCSSLSSLDLSNFDTSKVTDMYCMFDSCSSLSSLDLSSFDTSKVTSMGFMFSSCSSLSSLDLKNFDTSNVTDMYRMFYSCSSLSSLDLSSFDTSKVADMSNMFDSCTSLSSLDLSSFDTSNVTGMTSMFKGCKFTSIDVTNFNTSNVTDMSHMFESCISLSSLDLSNFDTSKVTDMARMFYNCSNLTTIFCKDDWNSYVVSTSDDMFTGCTSLKGAVAYDASKVDVSMANPTTGYFAVKEAYVVEDGATLTFYYDHNKATRTGTVYGIDDLIEGTSYPAWAGWTIEDNDRITKAVFDNSFKQYKPTSTQEWFNCCTKLESVEGIENLNTEKVTNMSSMFCGCSSLKSLDLSSLNTSNVLYMDNMFNDCSALQSINLTNINTEKVTTLNGMFFGCSSLTTLDLSTFNTANVTDLSWTFCSCNSLRTIYCNDDWNTSTVQYSDSMFDGCVSLKGAVEYDSSKVDASMANPTTGYFTKKDGGVESLESEAVPAVRRGIYNLQGIKMQGTFDRLPAGFYIVNGKKVFKK